MPGNLWSMAGEGMIRYSSLFSNLNSSHVKTEGTAAFDTEALIYILGETGAVSSK